jgi:hypothetical protein
VISCGGLFGNVSSLPMQLRLFLRHSNLLIILVGFFTVLSTASAQETGDLLLSGKVVNENKRGMEATIMLFRGKEKIDDFQTNIIGKFQTTVSLMDSIALVIYAEDYVSKTVFVNTFVPVTYATSDFAFPFFIDLYPIGRTPANIDLSRPVGKVIFSGAQFIYDIEFTKRQNEQLKDFVRERKDLKVREID